MSNQGWAHIRAPLQNVQDWRYTECGSLRLQLKGTKDGANKHDRKHVTPCQLVSGNVPGTR